MKHKNKFTRKITAFIMILIFLSVIPQYCYCSEPEPFPQISSHSLTFPDQNDI
jgi:hypothetical protein